MVRPVKLVDNSLQRKPSSGKKLGGKLKGGTKGFLKNRASGFAKKHAKKKFIALLTKNPYVFAIAVILFCACSLCCPAGFIASMNQLSQSDAQPECFQGAAPTGLAGSTGLPPAAQIGNVIPKNYNEKEQVDNSAQIIAVGNTRATKYKLSASDTSRAILIAIMTAMQESGLRNLNYGDRDSVGLFQQRPSSGWGTVAELTHPPTAAAKFYEALFKIDGWQKKSLTEAAQAVQRSAFPDAYAKHESNARLIIAYVAPGVSIFDDCNFSSVGGGNSGIVDAAKVYLGIPYVWGGGGKYGPSRSRNAACDDRGPGRSCGFDCSGLVIYAVWTASGKKTQPPATADLQARAMTLVPGATKGNYESVLKPGDIIAFSDNGGGRYGHIGIYSGNGKMVHAPQTGDVVKETDLSASYWQSRTWRMGRFVAV